MGSTNGYSVALAGVLGTLVWLAACTSSGGSKEAGDPDAARDGSTSSTEATDAGESTDANDIHGDDTMRDGGSGDDASISADASQRPRDAAGPDAQREPPVARCDGAQCCWTDCVTAEQTCGEFEPLEACSNVDVPPWFELRTCVVDYASLVPFTDGRQGDGYCACVRQDQVATVTIPIEETSEGCIYTYGGDPCNRADLDACFPDSQPDAGSGSGSEPPDGDDDECTSDSSCGSRSVCRDGRCVSVQCTTDSHCSGCSRCSSHVCRSCGSGPFGCYC